jgi:hypothetical protein
MGWFDDDYKKYRDDRIRRESNEARYNAERVRDEKASNFGNAIGKLVAFVFYIWLAWVVGVEVFKFIISKAGRFLTIFLRDPEWNSFQFFHGVMADRAIWYFLFLGLALLAYFGLPIFRKSKH